MQYTVYILYSKSINKYYVGYSTNPQQRLVYHNLGKSGNKNSFTKRANDWQIVYTKTFNNKQQAIKYEKLIKSKKSKVFIKNLTTKWIGSSMAEQPALNR